MDAAYVDDLLARVPDFRRAYEPDGLTIDEFDVRPDRPDAALVHRGVPRPPGHDPRPGAAEPGRSSSLTRVSRASGARARWRWRTLAHVSDRPRAHQHETSAPHGPDHPHDHGPDADHVHAPHDHDVEGGHAHGADGHGHDHPTGRLASMVAAVVGHSHDPADSLDSALAGDRRGIRAVQVSLVALGVTAVLQLGVVLLSGSVALLADTVHNFSDALTAVPLWIAFAIGGRAATRSYTFGYRRAEDLAGLFVLAMILFSALFAGWESINRLIHPQAITNIPAVIVAGIIGFLGNELVALYRIRVGRRSGAPRSSRTATTRAPTG